MRCPECHRFMRKRVYMEADGSGPSTLWYCTNPDDEGSGDDLYA